MKTQDSKMQDLLRKLVVENLLIEEETVDVEAHNAKVYDELKKNVSLISGIPEGLKSFYKNKIQDVLKADEGGIAYDQISSWLDDHEDYKALALKGDISGLSDKMKPIIQRREKKLISMMEQDEDLKRKEAAKKNIKFDEPLARLMRIVDEQINKRIANPKVLMTDLDAAAIMSLVPSLLVAVANLKK